ncbi:hypothetical protein Goklo_009645 [Gossypium klotzschianum]|uniref:Calmodulin-binding heat-shock protein n=1 Tax=Gossypium klotzschianum TaxID=34286 RepID=A0A7J8V3M0_9ROSI|nr:hypothetical protein [Gossypium klotzschianum]
MSIICGLPLLECIYCLACARWAWNRCLHTAGHDSVTWGLATAEEFEPVPRLCRYILAVYEDNIRHPLWEPPGGYGINPDWLILRKTYKDTRGRAPSYILYLDHEHTDIVLAIRGLNLAKESDYQVLLDNQLGKRKFDGGYVHNGLLKAAGWVLDAECEVLKELVEEHPNYTLTFAGHSLGSGVAAMLALVVVQHQDKLGNIDRSRIRCYAIAPARCMSLNLAVRYADVINSVVLQASYFSPPSMLGLDTCIPEEKMLKDPRRLYAPGRLYHIVERKPFSDVIVRMPCKARLSTCCMTAGFIAIRTFDLLMDTLHYIWLLQMWKVSPSCEDSSARGWKLMLEKDRIMEIPAKQRMERQETLTKEHKQEYKAALQRAVSLSVPHAYSPPSEYGTFDESEDVEKYNSCKLSSESSVGSSGKSKSKVSWNELIERLFDRDESGHMVLKKSHRDDW